MGPAGNATAIFVTRSEAEALDTELFRDFLTVWLAHKDGFGLPYPGSWTQQPWPVGYSLTLFQRLYNLEKQAATMADPPPSGGSQQREKQLGARGRRFRPRRGR